jgi:hypothetical protein
MFYPIVAVLSFFAGVYKTELVALVKKLFTKKTPVAKA